MMAMKDRDQRRQDTLALRDSLEEALTVREDQAARDSNLVPLATILAAQYIGAAIFWLAEVLDMATSQTPPANT